MTKLPLKPDDPASIAVCVIFVIFIIALKVVCRFWVCKNVCKKSRYQNSATQESQPYIIREEQTQIPETRNIPTFENVNNEGMTTTSSIAQDSLIHVPSENFTTNGQVASELYHSGGYYPRVQPPVADWRSPRIYEPEIDHDSRSPRIYEPAIYYDSRSQRIYEPEIDYQSRCPRIYEPAIDYDSRSPRIYEPAIDYDSRSPRIYEPEIDYDSQSPRIYEPQIDYD